MQMLSQKKVYNRRFKKSHVLVFGSLLVLVGIFVLSSNHLMFLKESVYSDMMLLISDSIALQEEIIEEVPIVEDLPIDMPVDEPIVETPIVVPEEKPKPPVINYDKYLGVLEIPRISLKRGFYDTSSPYNNIEQNVTLVKGSTMPDVVNGNLILMAHSGDAYISFFAYLYRLKAGSDVFITYNKVKYHYRIVNIYDVEKDGTVSIYRNYDKTTLTLITCTKNDQTKQTVYIAELV